MTEPTAAPRRPARRTQEERRRETREKLLAAAIDVLMRSGYNRLTLKEVAGAAGLSNGALMHHFTTKAELVVAATAVVYDEAILRGKHLASQPDAVKKPIEGFIGDCLSVYFDWPFIAALEAIVVARTDPELLERILPVMQHYRQSTNDVWLAVFRQAGLSARDARHLLNLTLNLVRGMAVNRLWQADDATYRSLIKEWVATANERYLRKDAAKA